MPIYKVAGGKVVLLNDGRLRLPTAAGPLASDSLKIFLEEKLTEQPGISNIKSSFSLKKVVDRVGVDFDLVRAP